MKVTTAIWKRSSPATSWVAEAILRLSVVDPRNSGANAVWRLAHDRDPLVPRVDASPSYSGQDEAKTPRSGWRRSLPLICLETSATGQRASWQLPAGPACCSVPDKAGRISFEQAIAVCDEGLQALTICRLAPSARALDPLTPRVGAPPVCR
jgi:hypothetical protein